MQFYGLAQQRNWSTDVMSADIMKLRIPWIHHSPHYQVVTLVSHGSHGVSIHRQIKQPRHWESTGDRWILPNKGLVTRKTFSCGHDDVIKWRHFPRYWTFVRGIHRSLVNSPHKGQWRGALVFSLNGWVNNREAGDLRRYRAHYDVTVMSVAEVYTFIPSTAHYSVYTAAQITFLSRPHKMYISYSSQNRTLKHFSK